MNGHSLRLMTEDDLPGVDALRRLANWNQTPAGVRALLNLEPEGCFVAAVDGQVIGTVTTTTYGQSLAWIGMMLVHPEHRKQGHATRLMQRALAYLQDREVKCVKLDATPAGQPVYERLGFIGEGSLTRRERLPAQDDLLPVRAYAETRILREADWTFVEHIDTLAFGVERARILRALAAECITMQVWPTTGPVAGWGMLRPGANADYIGPLVCPQEEGATALLAELLRAAGKRRVFWDSWNDHNSAQRLVRAFNFETLRPLTRMRFGAAIPVGDLRAQIAIADPSLG